MDAVLKALNDQKEMLEGKFAGIDGKFADAEAKLKDLEQRMTPRKVSLPGVEQTKFSFLKAAEAIRTGQWGNAGFEKEVFDETRKKALGAGTPADGGYIVPTEYVAELIEMLVAEAIVVKLGATVINDLKGNPVEFPKQVGGATAFWVGENTDITPSQQTLGQLTMSPHQVAALVKVSNRLLKFSSPAAEAMIRRDIAQSLSLALDLAALRGSGTSNQPLGIVNTPGIQNVEIGTNGGMFTFNTASEMEGMLEDVNALRGKLGFAWHGKVKRLLKNIKVAQYSGQTDGEPILGIPFLSDAKLKDVMGYDFGTSSQIPTNLTKASGVALSEIIFANWQELLIGQWGGLEIMASNETSDAFQKNQTWIRVVQEVDCGLRHPESFCLVNDASSVQL